MGNNEVAVRKAVKYAMVQNYLLFLYYEIMSYSRLQLLHL